VNAPPAAPRRPFRRTLHGVAITDDYAWLKDENWQQVLRDPSVLNADIRSYLEAENRYADAILGPTESLQKELVREMRGRIKEDDSGVPAPDGPFAYLWKFREGGQHELIGRTRRDGGDEQIVLDGDALAKDSGYFKFGGRRHSPGGTRRTTGSRPGAPTFADRNTSPSGCAAGKRAKTCPMS
jgi:oligopeptidase B